MYTESNFSPGFIDLLFSAQNTKVKKVFVLVTKITRLSLPSVSAVSLSHCPLDAEDAGGLMCSPAAHLESVWRSGLIRVCHSMTRGKWIYNQECLSLLCSLGNLPCSLAAKTGPASVLLAGTLRPGSSWPEVTNGVRHVQNKERGDGREADPERNPADPRASSRGPLQLLLCHFPPFHSLDNRLLAPRDFVCCCDRDRDSSAIRKSAKLPLRSLFFIISLFLAASHLT